MNRDIVWWCQIWIIPIPCFTTIFAHWMCNVKQSVFQLPFTLAIYLVDAHAFRTQRFSLCLFFFYFVLSIPLHCVFDMANSVPKQSVFLRYIIWLDFFSVYHRVKGLIHLSTVSQCIDVYIQFPTTTPTPWILCSHRIRTRIINIALFLHIRRFACVPAGMKLGNDVQFFSFFFCFTSVIDRKVV